MPITNDDQIDLERVVTDPEYRRHVIMYLNAQAHRIDKPRHATRNSAAVATHLGHNALLFSAACTAGADW